MHTPAFVGVPPVIPYLSLGSPGRVALALAYAGLKRAAILDGAFEKRVSEGKPVTTESTRITPVLYTYRCARDLFVDMEEVENSLGEIVLVDARDADVYAGAVIEPWSTKPGHIPTAVSLPASSLWNTADGTYKSKAEIKAAAEAVIGTCKKRDIVVYCGVGGYAGTVWFALTRILNYKNVKVYDGSAQEWTMTNDMEM